MYDYKTFKIPSENKIEMSTTILYGILTKELTWLWQKLAFIFYFKLFREVLNCDANLNDAYINEKMPVWTRI